MYVNSCATSMWASSKMEVWVKGSRLKGDEMPRAKDVQGKLRK
jgi:hypothetical protein